MASRVCIAAAGCMVASGLFMTGVGAAVAVADPASNQAGDGVAAQAGGAAGVGPAKTSGSGPSGSSTSSPTAGMTAPAGVAVPTKPTSQVGDGRTGRWAAEVGDHGGPPLAGKRTEESRPTPPQTPPTGAGEPTGRWHRPPRGMGWPWRGGPCPGHPGDPADPDDPDDPDDPGAPGLPPGTGVGSGGGSGGGGVPQAEPPRGRPNPPPAMQLPPPREVPPELPGLSADPLVDAAAGPGTAAVDVPAAPIAMPAIIAPVGSRPEIPSLPRTSGEPPRSESPPRSAQPEVPAFGVGNGVPPASFRAGYGNYLRTAGVGQMMALAVPGVAGILMLTGAGGLLGYRQASAGRAVRTNGAARFMD